MSTQDALWIGGSPCAGKSSIAEELAARRGWAFYCCDDMFDDHAVELGARRAPTMAKVTTMSVAARLAQPIGLQVSDVFSLYREEFPLIVRDVNARQGGVVMEGAALLPELLAAEDIGPERAVWIVPTEAFQREHYGRRQWARDALSKTSDPVAAFDRWMARDANFASTVADQARRLGYRVIVVGGEQSLIEVTAMVDAALSAWPSPQR